MALRPFFLPGLYCNSAKASQYSTIYLTDYAKLNRLTVQARQYILFILLELILNIKSFAGRLSEKLCFINSVQCD